MDLPVELVGLLKHAEVDGKKLTWDLQVNSSAVSIKLMWIKAAKPVEKTGEITSRAQKNKHLSPSTRRRNAQRMDQWKAKREAVGDNKTCVQTQTDDINLSTDERTQTEQLNSDAQVINIPTVLTKKRERSTQTRCTYTGMQPTSKKPTDTEDTSKEWKSCTTVRSPYNRMKLANLTEFREGSMSLSESFDPDDPARIDRFPDYPHETDIGDRPLGGDRHQYGQTSRIPSVRRS
jgi:hypothetical protein